MSWDVDIPPLVLTSLDRRTGILNGPWELLVLVLSKVVSTDVRRTGTRGRKLSKVVSTDVLRTGTRGRKDPLTDIGDVGGSLGDESQRSSTEVEELTVGPSCPCCPRGCRLRTNDFFFLPRGVAGRGTLSIRKDAKTGSGRLKRL